MFLVLPGGGWIYEPEGGEGRGLRRTGRSKNNSTSRQTRKTGICSGADYILVTPSSLQIGSNLFVGFRDPSLLESKTSLPDFLAQRKWFLTAFY